MPSIVVIHTGHAPATQWYAHEKGQHTVGKGTGKKGLKEQLQKFVKNNQQNKLTNGNFIN